MGDLSAISDQQLVTMVIEGDHDAVFHLLTDRCGPGIKHLVRVKYRGLGLDFQEVVSEMYLLLQRNDWKALRDFRGANTGGTPCRLSNYIYCIVARWLARKMSKTVKENTWTMSLHDMDAEDVAEDAPPVAILTGAELMEAVMALLDPVDRAVVMMYKLEDRNVDDVARQLGISAGNVYTRCSRAIKAMRSALQEREGV